MCVQSEKSAALEMFNEQSLYLYNSKTKDGSDFENEWQRFIFLGSGAVPRMRFALFVVGQKESEKRTHSF